jgi:hypothetical protein
MNILMFDLEDGHKTIGGKQEVKNLFNLPVLSPSSFDEFQSAITQLYISENVEETVMIAGLNIKQNTRKVTTRGGVGDTIDAVIIDTFSELSKKYQRSLVNKTTGTMKMQDWGKLKNKLDMLLEFVTRIPGIVVCNVHGKVSTMDDGSTRILPYIDGSTKEDISKWFDFVLYTKTVKNGKGLEYCWHTNHNDMYDHAKDRTQLLDETIPQDYDLIIKAAQAKGFDSVKILVIGSPGTGKTMSLKTLQTNNQTEGAPKNDD